MKNPVERTAPDLKRWSSDNSQAAWPLVNECKQKHMEVGAHGAHIWKNGGWAK